MDESAHRLGGLHPVGPLLCIGLYRWDRPSLPNTRHDGGYFLAAAARFRAPYLRKFGAGFRLSKITSASTRAGSTCTYSVAIGNASIAVSGTAAAGTPSFRSTLSAGDRNTLALAFFFASLDRDPDLASKVVVIDDPINSLDEHRHLTTVQEIGRLAARVGQLIVMSHSKRFLCQVWEGADKTSREAIEIVRSGAGSTTGPGPTTLEISGFIANFIQLR